MNSQARIAPPLIKELFPNYLTVEESLHELELAMEPGSKQFEIQRRELRCELIRLLNQGYFAMNHEAKERLGAFVFCQDLVKKRSTSLKDALQLIKNGTHVHIHPPSTCDSDVLINSVLHSAEEATSPKAESVVRGFEALRCGVKNALITYKTEGLETLFEDFFDAWQAYALEYFTALSP